MHRRDATRLSSPKSDATMKSLTLCNRKRPGTSYHAAKLQPRIPMPLMTGLSGNEIYCLHLKNLAPGELVIGNSVFSMGLIGSLGAVGRGLLGGEVPQITGVIHEGRLQAYRRMASEAEQRGGIGITGVTNELRTFHGNTEFLSVASTVHAPTHTDASAGASPPP